MSADDALDDRDRTLKHLEREERLVSALRSIINAWENPGPMGSMYQIPRAVSYAKSVLTERDA